MYKLILSLFFSISLLYSQVYNCTKRFSGEILKDTIVYNTIEECSTKLTIKKTNIIIEDGKYNYKLKQRVLKTNSEIIYYAIDWEDLKCIIIIENYSDFKYIYFQYENMVFGYKIIEI